MTRPPRRVVRSIGPPSAAGLPYDRASAVPAAIVPSHEGPHDDLFDDLGVRTVVNARGCATLAGGTLMAPEVVEAMAEAARSFVRIGDLQEVASTRHRRR